jgi:hypothetical protein
MNNYVPYEPIYVTIHREAEKTFAEQIIADCNEIITATPEQDMFEHWDIKCVGNKQTNENYTTLYKKYYSIGFSVDVKSLKKINRNDDLYDENIHWVELTNVRGNTGWLRGQADCFAFETKEYWVVVDKLSLQHYIAFTCDPLHQVCELKTSSPKLYKLYHRYKQDDEIIMIPTQKLKNMALCIFEKEHYTIEEQKQHTINTANRRLQLINN